MIRVWNMIANNRFFIWSYCQTEKFQLLFEAPAMGKHNLHLYLICKSQNFLLKLFRFIRCNEETLQLNCSSRALISLGDSYIGVDQDHQLSLNVAAGEAKAGMSDEDSD